MQGGQDHLVAAAKPAQCEFQRSELVVLVGISPGRIDDEIRLVAVHHRRPHIGQRTQVTIIARPVLHADVEVALLLHRIVSLLMHGKGEDRRVIAENVRGPVTLMQVQIRHERASDTRLLPEHPDGNGDVVHIAETLRVRGKGMVESAAQVADQRTPRNRLARGQQRPSGGQHIGVHDLAREGQFAVAGPVGPAQALEIVEILHRVHPFQLGARCRFRLHEVGLRGGAAGQESLPHQPVLGRREDVRTDVHLVGGAVHEDHDARIVSRTGGMSSLTRRST